MVDQPPLPPASLQLSKREEEMASPIFTSPSPSTWITKEMDFLLELPPVCLPDHLLEVVWELELRGYA